jgi:hypothetical protein
VGLFYPRVNVWLIKLACLVFINVTVVVWAAEIIKRISQSRINLMVINENQRIHKWYIFSQFFAPICFRHFLTIIRMRCYRVQ